MNKNYSMYTYRYLTLISLIISFSVMVLSVKSYAMPNMENAFTSVSFIDEENNDLRLDKFRGKVILLFFGYTHCPDICPTTLSDIARTLTELGKDADKTQTIFISVDYKRDTAESLAQYTSYFDSRILGVTSDKKNIDMITKSFKTTYALLDHESESYLVEHSSNIYIIDQNLVVQRILPNGLPYSEITKAVKNQL